MLRSSFMTTPGRTDNGICLRSGTTLFELLITLLLLGAVAGSVVPVVRWSGLQRAENERRMLAQEVARNLLERVLTLPYDKLTAEELNNLQLPSEVQSALGYPRIEWRLADAKDSIRSRRVDLRFVWKLQNGIDSAPLRATLWRHPPPEAGT